ncbi:hypothetical protein ASF39_04450 [Methylobacterium sp. Leaf108]|nr:hypothetical protein ASF39_04450 [Methylobacterium sp. Leaf108]
MLPRSSPSGRTLPRFVFAILHRKIRDAREFAGVARDHHQAALQGLAGDQDVVRADRRPGGGERGADFRGSLGVGRREVQDRKAKAFELLDRPLGTDGAIGLIEKLMRDDDR